MPSPALLLRVASGCQRVSGLAGCEVAECPPVAALPMAPPWLVGVAVHKGEALPLVDLDAVLAGREARAPGPRSRMLVTHGGGCRVAFVVDDVDADDGREDAGPLDLDALTRGLLALPCDDREPAP